MARPGSLPELESSDLRTETYHGLKLAADRSTRSDQSDSVLGLGPATRTLAKLTIRRPVESALDLGTGSGVQALLASRHARRVVGVDVNRRALAVAELNGLTNGIENVDWREGSWFEPVRGERFGLIVANPPYVISPESDLVYRDSGEKTDALVMRLLVELPGLLEEGGFAQMLCNWVVGPDGDWRRPLDEVTSGQGCDAVFLRYQQLDPVEYAKRWHRQLEQADESAFREKVERWLAYYREHSVEAIAFGLVVLRRRSTGRNWSRALEVPAAPTDGAGDHVARLFEGRDAALQVGGGEVEVLPAPGGRVVRRLDLEDGRERITLEVRPNVGFAARIDPGVADLLEGRRPLPEEEARRLIGLGLLTASDL